MDGAGRCHNQAVSGVGVGIMTTIQGRIPVLLRRLLMVVSMVVFLALAGTLTASAEPVPDPPRPPQDCIGKTNPGWADLTDCASKKPQPGQGSSAIAIGR